VCQLEGLSRIALRIPLDILAEGLRNDAAWRKATVIWIIRLGSAVRCTCASAAVLVIAALATVHAAQQFWEKTPFTEWTRAEAIKVLSSSPWVRQVSILVPATDGATVDADPTGTYPRAGAGAPSVSGTPPHQRARLTVMWVAAPIREAHIRLDQFSGHMRDEKYWRPAVRGNPEIIQLTVAGAALAQLLRGDDLRPRAAYLKTKRGKQVTASDVVFSKDYPRIPEVTLVFPAHIDGAASITTVDEEATLVMPLDAHTITARFKLRDMIVRGQLML
jgi:hypothetical protein